MKVDADMRPQGAPHVLIGEGLDPRAIKFGNQVLIFFAAIERDASGALSGSSVTLAAYDVAGDAWTCTGLYRLPKRPIQGAAGPDSTPDWEKNWFPFRSIMNWSG